MAIVNYNAKYSDKGELDVALKPPPSPTSSTIMVLTDNVVVSSI